METIDLDKPQDARKFLADFKVSGRKVTGVELESGKWLEFSDMTDDQIIRYAKDIYFDFLGGKESGGVVNTDIDLGQH